MQVLSSPISSSRGRFLTSCCAAGVFALALAACSDEAGTSDGGDGSSTGGAGNGPSTETGGAPSTGTGGVGTGTGGTLAGSGGLGGSGPDQGTGGEPGEDRVCPLPESFQWVSSGPLADPKSPPGANWVSLKDFSIARHNDQYVVYATAFNATQGANSGWQGVHYNFSDFAQMGSATQTHIPGMVAPTIFYFTPKNIWVLAYQWGFKYATSTNPSDPKSWSATKSLLSGDPTAGHPKGSGPIDQTIICDDAKCYMFFAGDNGYIYRSSMPINDFPGTFVGADVVLQDNVPQALFEAVQVYKVKGTDKYLMIVEAADNNGGWGSRYFRAFTATDLGGSWTPMPKANSRQTPFAGSSNVTFPGGQWTNDISHGDVVRDDPSEKMEIDMCNLRFLYQGAQPGNYGDYGNTPYRPGLLTLVQPDD